MNEPTNLEQLLDRVREAAPDRDRISFGAILKVIGRRSFGPVLLVAGLVTLAPVIGDIPGIPTIIGIFVFLISVQLLFRRDHLWIPGFLLKRSVARDKLRKALKWMQPAARFIDRLLRPRLTIFVEGAVVYVIAIVCIAIAATMPLMELVPLSANAAGAALAAYGLSLISRDGLLALIAFAFTVTGGGLVVFNLY
ncbi:MAG: exopolysaccharide biosynthesis protein [Desulfobacteraceae bacterium]|nr:MAG: exopolysaccharide biosynthesis protein [Desulfobacteraceae bacterium]